MKVKKKRAVDPNAPPRPNLLSQDKKLRDLQGKFNRMQQAFDQLVTYVRRDK